MKKIIFYSVALLILVSLIGTLTPPIKSNLEVNNLPYSPIYGFGGTGYEPLFYGRNTYFSNSDSFFVSKFDTSGKFINQHFIYLSDHPCELACSNDGYLYVAKDSGGINKYTFSGTTISLNFITNVKPTCIFPAYNIIYIADANNQRIMKYSAATGDVIDSNFITNVNAISLEILDSILFVATGSQNSIRAYNRFTGILTNSNIIAGHDSIQNINEIFFSADTSLYISSSRIDSIGSNNLAQRTSISSVNSIKKPTGGGGGTNSVTNFSRNVLPLPPPTQVCIDCGYCTPTDCHPFYGPDIQKVYHFSCNNCQLWIWHTCSYIGCLLPNRQIHATADEKIPVDCNYQPHANFDNNNSNCPCPPKGDYPLPIEMSSFSSSISHRNVLLNWSTASEENNSGFDIERSQNNDWSKIGFVHGNGTATNPNSYSYEDRNLSSGKYKYRLKQIDFNGNFKYYDLQDEVNIGTPDRFSLDQNYPNPFNPVTKINFDIPNDGLVTLKIFDNNGREVKTIVNEFKPAGYYTAEFDGSNLSSGIYFYRLESGNFVASKKMMLLK